jgi:hypothetical protein
MRDILISTVLSLFQIPQATVQTKTIVFQVFDSDLGKDKPLGEVGTHDLGEADPWVRWIHVS